MIRMEWRVERDSGDITLVYAADELASYLRQIDPAIDVAILKSGSGAIFKNTLKLQVGGTSLPLHENATLDDAYHINVANGAGVIAGSNARSVLLGVYRFLRELGCRWVRPGRDGEMIPERDLSEISVDLSDSASYRHRGVCIEGSCSFTHVYDMINWLPKIGMNSYFMQFSTPFAFFDYWYRHINNPNMEAQPASVEEVTAMVSVLNEHIKKLGLLLHATGHGWTCDPIGIRGLGWGKEEFDITDEQRDLLALVDGKREVYKGIALNTNLCYSNPIARKKIIDAIVIYCQKHHEVDYLHFWLADEVNNQCECENCKDTSPADFYVLMLNEIDKRLTAADLPTKIVFLIYFDLLWEPQAERFINQDRFTLMFAPITRTYTKAYCDDFGGIKGATEAVKELAPYVRNKLTLPESVGENVARLGRWQEIFSGDSFDFDYHMFWDHNYDPGGFESARILFEDMKSLDRIDLRGMISCQCQRVFFPTGLAMNAMAAALWNKNQTFEDFNYAFFSDMFGEFASEMIDYFKTLSKLFQPPYLRGEQEYISEDSAKMFDDIPDVLNEMLPKLIARHDNETNPCRKKTWYALTLHSQLCSLLADTLSLKAKGLQSESEKGWERTVEYANNIEPLIHELFDAKYFVDVVGRPVRGVGNWG